MTNTVRAFFPDHDGQSAVVAVPVRWPTATRDDHLIVSRVGGDRPPEARGPLIGPESDVVVEVESDPLVHSADLLARGEPLAMPCVLPLLVVARPPMVEIPVRENDPGPVREVVRQL